MVKELVAYDEFNQLLDSHPDQLIVVDFTATWCGPCQYMAPILENLSKDFNNVVFVKVDVDKNQVIFYSLMFYSINLCRKPLKNAIFLQCQHFIFIKTRI